MVLPAYQNWNYERAREMAIKLKFEFDTMSALSNWVQSINQDCCDDCTHWIGKV